MYCGLVVMLSMVTDRLLNDPVPLELVGRQILRQLFVRHRANPAGVIVTELDPGLCRGYLLEDSNDNLMETR